MRTVGAFVTGVVVSGVALVAVAIATGLLSLGPKAAPQKSRCDGQGKACEVHVNLDCWANICTSGSLSVTEDPLLVNSKQTAGQVTWILIDSSNRFSLTDTSVQFGSDAANVVTQCKAKTLGNGETRVTCQNAHPGFDAFKYTLTVRGVGSLDPWMVND